MLAHRKASTNDTAASLGVEANLWLTADIANPAFNDAVWFCNDDGQNLRDARSRNIHPWNEAVCPTQ